MEVKKEMINATRGGMNMNVSTPETGKLNCKKSISEIAVIGNGDAQIVYMPAKSVD